jgi:uncharacterized membrane protein YhfC
MEMKKILPALNTITALFLLIGIFSLPYGYYTFLRIIVTTCGALNVYFAFQEKKQFVLILSVLITILFNPIIPIYLQKETWVALDIIAALIIVSNIFFIKRPGDNPKGGV